MTSYRRHTIALLLLLLNSTISFADEDIDLRINQDLQQQIIKQEQRLLQEIKSTTDTEHNNISNVTTEDMNKLAAEIFIAVNQQNWAILSALLQQYQNLTGFDPDLLKFAQAALAHGKGDYKQAISIYQQLIKDHPEFLRGRLELARALFEDNQNRESSTEFANIDLGNAYPDIQENIQIYQNVIKSREQWQSYLSFGYLHHSNINRASNKTECLSEYLGICLTSRSGGESIAARGGEYEFSTRKRWSLLGHHGVNLKINSYGTAFNNYRAYNDSTHNIAVGYSFKNAKSEFTITPNFTINTIDNDKMNHSYGIEANWQYLLGARSMLYSGYQYKNYIYTRSDYQHHSGVGHTINSTITYVLPHDFVVFWGLDLNSKGARYKVDSYRQIGTRLGVIKNFGGFEGTLYGSIMRRKYRNFHFHYQAYRQDTEKNIILTINVPRWRVWGITPSIRLKHNRNKSNVDWLYTNKSSEISLRLFKYF